MSRAKDNCWLPKVTAAILDLDVVFDETSRDDTRSSYFPLSDNHIERVLVPPLQAYLYFNSMELFCSLLSQPRIIIYIGIAASQFS